MLEKKFREALENEINLTVNKRCKKNLNHNSTKKKLSVRKTKKVFKINNL